MWYMLHGTVVETTRTGTVTREVPTFFLHSNVQGIVSEKHAIQIGEGVVNPTRNPAHAVTLFASVVSELDKPIVL